MALRFYEQAFLDRHKKTEVIISKVHSSDGVSLYPGSDVFKRSAGNMLFRANIGTGKKNFLKQFLESFRAGKSFMQ